MARRSQPSGAIIIGSSPGAVIGCRSRPRKIDPPWTSPLNSIVVRGRVPMKMHCVAYLHRLEKQARLLRRQAHTTVGAGESGDFLASSIAAGVAPGPNGHHVG